MNEARVPRGIPSGGQYVASARPETPIALQVEFSRDEAEQVAHALVRTTDDWDAATAASEQVAILRRHLVDSRRFARRVFLPDEIAAMATALGNHRREVSHDFDALSATEAALFRLDLAEPYYPAA